MGGRNPLAGTQSGSLHAEKLPSGGKKSVKIQFFYTISSSSTQMQTGIETVGGTGMILERRFFVKKIRRLTPKSDSKIKVTGR